MAHNNRSTNREDDLSRAITKAAGLWKVVRAKHAASTIARLRKWRSGRARKGHRRTDALCCSEILDADDETVLFATVPRAFEMAIERTVIEQKDDLLDSLLLGMRGGDVCSLTPESFLAACAICIGTYSGGLGDNENEAKFNDAMCENVLRALDRWILVFEGREQLNSCPMLRRELMCFLDGVNAEDGSKCDRFGAHARHSKWAMGIVEILQDIEKGAVVTLESTTPSKEDEYALSVFCSASVVHDAVNKWSRVEQRQPPHKRRLRMKAKAQASSIVRHWGRRESLELRFLEHSPTSVAEQLTLLLSALSYRHIHALDLWTESRRREGPASEARSDGRLPVAIFASFFEALSMLPLHGLLGNEDISVARRRELLRFWTFCAVALRKLHNYHLCFAVISALSCPALMWIWNEDAVADDVKAAFEGLKRLSSPKHDYRVARAELSKVTSEPCIPFLGILCKHLLALETMQGMFSCLTRSLSHEVVLVSYLTWSQHSSSASS